MSAIWKEAIEIWLAGGWAMILLAINAFLLFWLGLAVKFKLSAKEYRSLPEKTYKAWIDNPQQGQGAIGRLVEFAMNSRSLRQMESLFNEFRFRQIRLFERDLGIIRVCVSASPLLGLLGTVTGMLTTFNALAIGSGGEKTMNMVAGGISEALITTETGLIIAFPGLLFLHHLQQGLEKYKSFLAHVETVCAQALHARSSSVNTHVQFAGAQPADHSDIPPQVKLAAAGCGNGVGE